MLHGHLRPGYDYLLERKFSSLWRELDDSPVASDLARFRAAAAELGFGDRVPDRQRLPGPGPAADPDWPQARPADNGRPRRIRRSMPGTRAAHRGRLAALQVRAQLHPPGPVPPRHRAHAATVRAEPQAFADRLAGITPPIAGAMTAYLERKMATCKPKTVSSLATRLMHFGRFLTGTDPGLVTLAALDRRRHIEP